MQGETTSNYFGIELVAGDLQCRRENDLAINAYGYSTDTGRVYIFITEAAPSSKTQYLKIKGGGRSKGGFRVRMMNEVLNYKNF
jgi:hypothetical protein